MIFAFLAIVGDAVVNKAAGAACQRADTRAFAATCDRANSSTHTCAAGNDLRGSSRGAVVMPAAPVNPLRLGRHVNAIRLLVFHGRRRRRAHRAYVARNCVRR